MVEIVGGDAAHLCAKRTGADQERYREPLRKTPRARSRAAPHTGWIDRRRQVWRDVPASGAAYTWRAHRRHRRSVAIACDREFEARRVDRGALWRGFPR